MSSSRSVGWAGTRECRALNTNKEADVSFVVVVVVVVVVVFFLWLHPQHMEVPRPGVRSKL